MDPRVPETQAARALLWALLAAAAFGASAAPRDPGRLAWQRDTGECRLAPLRPGLAPCPCSAVPLALRETLGLAAPLNALGARELERVPGIGPVRAAAIERERARGGAFAQVDELARRVPGLGPKTVDRIRPVGGVGGSRESESKRPRLARSLTRRGSATAVAGLARDLSKRRAAPGARREGPALPVGRSGAL